MAWRLMERIPLMRSIRPLVKYSQYLAQSDFRVDALLWIIICCIFSFFMGALTVLLLPKLWYIGLLIFIVFLDLSVGYPYWLAMKRIDQIEENLPDALRQMSDTLRAGGTYEYAMREVATADYGPLKVEFNNVLRKLEEGENLENALSTLSENVDSRLVKRTVTIIIDSVKAGAGLADILDSIAEDVRAMRRIERERKSRTLMQVLFMVAASAFVAPLIFGFVVTIINLLFSAASAVASAEQQAAAQNANNIILFAMQAYIFTEIAAASTMISLMREGRISKAIIYFPILLFIAYVIYLGAQIASMAMVR